MLRLAVTGILALGLCLAAACSSAQAPTPTPPRPDSWKRVMQEVDTRLDLVARQLQSPGFGDLRQVANGARAAANAMARGYGDLEQQDVPGFAGMARETETWLLQLGLEAGQGHGDLARDLYRQRELRYCSRCHEAAEQQGRRFDFGKPREAK